MAKPAIKPAFGAGVLSGLRATAGAAGGEPLFLLLDQIEEDPDQPRTSFDQVELEQLAETIRQYGVLTPVGVRKVEGERYRLVYGARRLRASRLAEQTRIPATILSEDKAGLAVQVIENQARANLSNRDLATAVNRLFADGKKVKQIAAICNLKEYQVAAYRSVERLPPVLAERLDHADMRAIYDLFRAWEKDGPAIEGAMPAPDVFLTITEARRIIEAVTGKASNSVFLTRGKEPEQITPATNIEPPSPEPTTASSDGPGASEPPRAPPEPLAPTKAKPKATAQAVVEPTPAAPAATQPRPRFVLETADGRRGVLVTERRAEQAGSVLLEIGGESVEVAFSELRPIEVA